MAKMQKGRMHHLDGGRPRSRRHKNHTEGAPGPLLLGTGETQDFNWQEEAHGLAESVPITPIGHEIDWRACSDPDFRRLAG
jgi:hypothetical protein